MSKFNVGDRVRAVGNLWLSADNTGKCGEVYGPDYGLGICVKFDDGTADYGRYADFELIGTTEFSNDMALKEALQSLHDQFRTAGNTVPALALEEVISEHFGVTWQEPQEGCWVEKEIAA